MKDTNLLAKHSRWTEQEDKILSENYPIFGTKYCCDLLKRPFGGVRQRIRKLKLQYKGRAHNFKDITGHQIGKLRVIKHSHTEKNIVYWECICECGNTTTVASQRLRENITRSCGCLWQESMTKALYKGGQYITGTQFNRIRQNAKTKNIDFDITLEDIELLFDKQNKKCALSGRDLIFESTIQQGGGNIIRGNASVDRIDSSLGYVLDNIQILDKDVNYAKRILSQEDFIRLCKEVSEYQEKRL
jgi:hypothetical protein